MLDPLDDNAPRSIGPYELLAHLGAGGMGEVYVGRDPTGAPERLAAVKTVRAELAGDPAFRRRFHREIRLAGQVGGAHVAGLLGGDADGEPPWLATEYVPGPDLGEAVRRTGPLPEATVRALGAGLAAALRAIHAEGILHRDLKPANVLLAESGTRVIDFGIARARGVTTLTATGRIVGTPGFMSPEHIAGSRKVSTASDVFSLGSVLCYAATGRGPFGEGQPAAVLYRIAEEEPDLDEVPAGLRELLTRCLDKDPAGRPTAVDLAASLGDPGSPDWPPAVRARINEYEDAAERLRGLPAGAAHPPAVPPAPPAPERVRPAGRWRRVLLYAAGGLAVMVLSAGTVVVLDPFSPDTPAARPTGAAPAPGEGADATGRLVDGIDVTGGLDGSGVIPQDPSQRPEGWQQWQGKLSQPPMGCAADEVALVCQLVDGGYEAVSTADGRRLWRAAPEAEPAGWDSIEEAAYLGAAGDLHIPGSGGSPTVREGVAVYGAYGRLQVRDAATGRLRWQKRHKDSMGGYKGDFFGRPVVADGRVFATVSEKVVAYDLDSGKELWRNNLTNESLAMAERRLKFFAATTYAHDRLYARTDLGLVAYDPETGNTLAESPAYDYECSHVNVRGEAAYCGGSVKNKSGEGFTRVFRRHDALTLRPEATVRVPEVASSTLIGAVEESTMILSDYHRGDIVVADRESGEVQQRFAFRDEALGRYQLVSSPVIAGDRILFADASRLYVLPLDAPESEPLRIDINGAPGSRARAEWNPTDGLPVADVPRHPWVLPLGGVVHLVYDRGRIISVPLPDAPGR
ncbi:protein kinase domain-containing protein [Streptomyces sp. MAR4 CNY-716]